MVTPFLLPDFFSFLTKTGFHNKTFLKLLCPDFVENPENEY